MRVPEISLVNELQAQNKHDLYRYHKYKREYQQTQYLTACTVSFMVVPMCGHGGLVRCTHTITVFTRQLTV